MIKNQRGFAHLVAIVLFVLVLGALAFVGFKAFNNDNVPNPDKRGPNYQALQTCGDKPLHTAPADISQLEQIGPLGNVDTPDHTLPTDHMYPGYAYGSSEQRQTFAPADIVVTSISYGGEFENGALKNADYAFSFYPCRELKIIYGHMDVLSPALAAAVGSDFDNNVGCSNHNQEYKEIKNCMKDVDIQVSAGELLATTNGWDLWATYEGFVSPNVVSPEYYHNADAVCPLDYFTDDLQAQLYAKVRRDGQPKCGEAYQDKTNTLQGGWFAHKDPNKAKTDWSSHFSLTHNSQETGIGQLAMAKEDFMYRFTPKHSGTINREPSETTAGTVYCYEHEGDRRFPNGVIAGDGKVLLELIDNHTMKFEHKAETCTANESFLNPITYYR